MSIDDVTFARALADFRPQFGNTQHIHIANKIAQYNKKMETLRNSKSYTANTRKINKELGELRHQIIHLIIHHSGHK